MSKLWNRISEPVYSLCAPTMNRRSFSRLAALSALPFVSCGKKDDGGSDQEKAVLRIFTWLDYFDPARIEQFQQEHDCRLQIETYPSNEVMLRRLEEGEQFDLLTPSSYMVRRLVEKGLIVSLDPSIRGDTGSTPVDGGDVFSVPYLSGVSGLSWLGAAPVEGACSWKWILSDRVKGRVTLLDDMRETLGAALKSLGFSGNSRVPSEIAEAEKQVIAWRDHLAGFESEYYKIGVVSGEYALVHGYSGDVYQAWTRNPTIQFAVPSEGSMISTDEFCVTAGASEPELAREFIRFHTRPEVILDHEKYTGFFRPGNDAVKVVSPVPDSFRPDLSKCEEILDLGEALAVWTEAWNRIRMD